MLNKVTTSKKDFRNYKKFVNNKEFLHIKKLAQKLSKLKIIHISSTSQGGGVAEMLHSLIPLFNSLGIKTEWYTFNAPKKFFEITKQVHNALQSSHSALNKKEKKYYLKVNQKLGKEIDKLKCDILIIHDPQPLASVAWLKKLDKVKKIVRIHIDLSKPNFRTFNFIKKYLDNYDKVILSNSKYIHRYFDNNKLNIFQPAIDPLSLKNSPLAKSQARKILKDLGIDIKKPLITQVSRFDPWKDPVGVVKVYKKLKKRIPDLQLAYLGIIQAKDDPEAYRILKEIKKKSANDKDIHLFSSTGQLKSYPIDLVVNAFQVWSDVILQKSLKEGFGLTVTEAMWQENPVVGGNVGGIKLQITNGKNGFLVNNKKQAVQRVLQLLKNKKLKNKMGKLAKQSVQKKFLITRLINDYLKLFEQLN